MYLKKIVGFNSRLFALIKTVHFLTGGIKMISDTIAAISTSTTSSGGIGIIRLSGEAAIDIVNKIFKGKCADIDLTKSESYKAHYGIIHDEDRYVDEAIVLVMKAPNTYTRENVVEIQCHGGLFIVNKILELTIKMGARPAEPGEFTKRAFLNGRIDLSQAEAVMDLIASKNEFALKSSFNQLQGKISKKVEEYRKVIIHHTAFIEAALDDPEHYELSNYGEKLLTDVDNLVENLEKLLITADNGTILKEGIDTVILGKPNAGKSSLLNVLARRERAIVTDIAGTTRDTLEEQINLDGLTLNLIDTAGIRDTSDIVEKLGVDKAIEYAKDASLILYVVDSSVPLDENDEKIISMIKDKKVIVLLNKSDLQTVISPEDMKNITGGEVLSISAKYDDDISQLSELIRRMFINGEIEENDEACITNIRQKTALQEAIKSLKMVVSSINDGMPEDFYTIDLLNAYTELSKIIGESVEEDLVNEIFSKFCMGK